MVYPFVFKLIAVENSIVENLHYFGNNRVLHPNKEGIIKPEKLRNKKSYDTESWP